MSQTTYISFASRITTASTDALVELCAKISNAGGESVYLMMSTPGGSVDSAIAAYTLLRAMPFRLTTHNIGRVDSIGNVLFLAGDTRYACSHSSFMFHGVGFNVDKQSRYDMRGLREKTGSIERDQQRISAILEERTLMDPAQIPALFEDTVIRDAEQSLATGVIEAIHEPEIPAGATIRHVSART